MNICVAGCGNAVARHNAAGKPPIDLAQVGDEPELPLGADDAELLQWTEREDRILVSRDVHTLPLALAAHRGAGHHAPGILLIRNGASLRAVVETLALVAHAGEADEWANRCTFIPFD